MPAAALEGFLFDLLAAFAGAFTAPPLGLAVLLISSRLASAGRARAFAAGLGLAYGALELALATTPASPSAGLAQLAGSALAAWLLAELVLQILLPALRLARRILVLLVSRLGPLR